MNRLMIVGRLRPATAAKAEALVRAGPPFDPEDFGLDQHNVFLSGTEVVFLFEGRNVERVVDGIVNDPALSSALAPWAEVIEWPPRIAHERYSWHARQVPKIGLGF